MRIIIYISIISFFLQTAKAQAPRKSFYFGAEIGVSQSIIHYSDNGNMAHSPMQFNKPIIWGGNLGYHYGNFFSELAITAHNQDVRMYRFKASSGYGTSTEGFELANRYGYDIKLHKRKHYYLSPILGYRIGFGTNGNNEWKQTVEDSLHDSRATGGGRPLVLLDYNSRLNNGVYHLLETGLQFSHFVFEDRWRLSISARYMQGFQRIAESRLSYEFPDGSAGEASYWQYGGYWSMGIGLNYYFYKNAKI